MKIDMDKLDRWGEGVTEKRLAELRGVLLREFV